METSGDGHHHENEVWFSAAPSCPNAEHFSRGVERVGSMSRNRATAKQRKQQQYRYGYRASSQRTQGETVPEAFKPFAAEERCAERARLAEELAHTLSLTCTPEAASIKPPEIGTKTH